MRKLQLLTKMRRGWLLAAAVTLTASTSVILATSANALTVSDPVGGGAFQLDGNALKSVPPSTAGDDWDNVCHQVSPASCPSATNTSGATAVSWVAEPNPNSTIFQGGGSKDPQNIDQWAWKDGAGGLPDKDNLEHGFAARYSQTPSATCPSTGPGGVVFPTCEVLYFGSDRFDNSGDAQQGFWFFQSAVGLGSNAVGGGTGFTGAHTNGDILVVSDFSIGGATSIITVFAWDTSCLKAASSTPVPGTCASPNLRTLGTSDAARCDLAAVPSPFCGIVNPADGTVAPWPFTDKTSISAAHPANTYLQGEFYEGGINLSSLGLGNECFSSVESETRSSTSPTATLKDFVLGPFGHCTPSITTTPSVGAGGVSIGTGGPISVTDQANVGVGGTTLWSGSVDFHLCGPIASGNCSTGGTDVGSTSVDNNSTEPISSPAATVTSVGRYCWRGDFTVTSPTGLTPVSDPPDASSTTECFTVTPVTPTLTTTAGSSPVNLGQPVTDTASLTGTATQPGSPIINGPAGAAAGGSISFTLLKADCSTLATGTGTNPQSVTVSGDNTSYGPVSFTPDTPGTYHWVATYTPAVGDPNNVGSTHNSACNDTKEDVTINQVPTSITTRQFVFPQDKASVGATGGGPLAGNVSFKLYDSATNCATNTATGLLYSELTHAISGTAPQTASTNNTTFRLSSNAQVYWRVTYTSTNTAQLGSSSVCVENTSVAYTGNDGSISIP
jgi:hypothetical protein